MIFQTWTIGKAIRALFADRVTYVYTLAVKFCHNLNTYNYVFVYVIGRMAVVFGINSASIVNRKE